MDNSMFECIYRFTWIITAGDCELVPIYSHLQISSLDWYDRVITADAMFQAFNCQLECQLNINVYEREDVDRTVVYSRSGHLIPRSHSEWIHLLHTAQCIVIVQLPDTRHWELWLCTLLFYVVALYTVVCWKSCVKHVDKHVCMSLWNT